MLSQYCLLPLQLRCLLPLLFWWRWRRLLRPLALMSRLITCTPLMILTHCGVQLISQSRRPQLPLCQPSVRTLLGRLGCRMLLTLPKCFSKGVWQFWRIMDCGTKRLCRRWHPWRRRSPSGGLLLRLFGEWNALRWTMPPLLLLRPQGQTTNCIPRLVVCWPSCYAPS